MRRNFLLNASGQTGEIDFRLCHVSPSLNAAAANIIFWCSCLRQSTTIYHRDRYINLPLKRPGSFKGHGCQFGPRNIYQQPPTRLDTCLSSSSHELWKQNHSPTVYFYSRLFSSINSFDRSDQLRSCAAEMRFSTTATLSAAAILAGMYNIHL